MGWKKSKKLVIVALLVGIIGWVLPWQEDTFDEFVVNNTNLAPSSSGHAGTGERIANNTTYSNPSNDIELFVWAHANASGQTSEIHLFVNGTKVADTSGRPLGAAEENNKTIIATIPKNTNYSVEVKNYHHYEWREWKRVSGRNGSLGINQTVISGSPLNNSPVFNAVYTNIFGANNSSQVIRLDNPLRKTSPTNQAQIDMDIGDKIQISETIMSTGEQGLIKWTPTSLLIQVVGSYNSYIQILPNNITLSSQNISIQSGNVSILSENITISNISWAKTFHPWYGTTRSGTWNFFAFSGEVSGGTWGGQTVNATNNAEFLWNVTMYPGNYSLWYTYIGAVNRGVAETWINGTCGENLLSTTDQYAAADTPNIVVKSDFYLTSKCQGYLSLKANGNKNAGSGLYVVYADNLFIESRP